MRSVHAGEVSVTGTDSGERGQNGEQILTAPVLDEKRRPRASNRCSRRPLSIQFRCQFHRLPILRRLAETRVEMQAMRVLLRTPPFLLASPGYFSLMRGMLR